MLRAAMMCCAVLALASNVVAADRPNIILISLDTTRADRMGFLGSKRGLTPNLDEVARQGVVFTRAYSQAPITTVSHATIFTGTYPQFHRVNDFGIPLPKSLPALAELLKNKGYRTAAFVGSLILDPSNGLAPGFDRGFETYYAGYRRRQVGMDRYSAGERRAEQVVARAVAWLENHSGGPFFLWVHVFDPHDPYDAPPEFAKRFPGAPYDAEIAYTDANIGKLFAALRARGVYDTSAIMILADHGESLGQHGENTHGIFLYDETIRVPLVLKLPQNRSAEQRVDARVGLLDVAPSLLEIAGVPVPPIMQGQSLIRLLGRTQPAERPVYAETDYPRRAFGWSSLAAWRSGKYLYVRAPKPELYDLSVDPQAKKNLAPTSRQALARIAAQVEDFRKQSSGLATATGDAPLDPRLIEKLSALGYVAGSGRAPAPKGSGIDPKEKMDVANTLHDAVQAMEDGRHAEVIPLLERVVATDPQIFIAQFHLGTAYVRQKNYAKAIAPLRAATELLPEAGFAHYELGLAYYRTGDLKKSAAHFEIVSALMPNWADAHFSLASVWARSNRVPEAMGRLDVALKLDPEHYQANLLRGRILSLNRQAAAALPYLEKAAASPEASGEAHAFLADAYEQLGRNDDAQRARARAGEGKRRPSTP